MTSRTTLSPTLIILSNPPTKNSVGAVSLVLKRKLENEALRKLSGTNSNGAISVAYLCPNVTFLPSLESCTSYSIGPAGLDPSNIPFTYNFKPVVKSSESNVIVIRYHLSTSKSEENRSYV